MPSNARTEYDRLNSDVGSLLDLHPSIANPGPGRPPGDTGPLLRATVVLIHTAWENYVEQAILEANAWILSHIGASHADLPTGLRRAVASHAQKFDPFDITGTGWSNVARRHVETKVGKLNTPNAQNVNELTKDCTGVDAIMGEISWTNRTSQQVEVLLNTFVHDVRGEIVHKGTTPGPLNLPGVRDWRDFAGRLVSKYDLKLSACLADKHGAAPW